MKKALAAATEFFNPVDPKELVRKWQATLRQEQRALDRQVREIKVEENKVKKSIKEAAKRGDLVTAKTLAKEVIHSRHAVSRLVTNKAQLMSIGNALTTQMAMVRVTATLSKSTEVMQAVTAAMRLPEMQKTMMEMSREMMKAGLIDEMMSDAVDGALDDAELDEETEEQDVGCGPSWACLGAADDLGSSYKTLAALAEACIKLECMPVVFGRCRDAW
ncbi:uncharacterized protein HaLaN_02305 [Haematococcus lacustris]|uniref:Charged multivesicular body protein 3 n=1 Tax=Haematococcus lacustris TaxID=44745 RepID=A0A699YDP0_HAELA|nr:uncharacterized protein HaLaN_02305 [Haematococcus lacustris]